MSVFIESPWPILFFGITIEAVLGFLLFQTGRGKLLWAMLAVAAVMGAGLTVEHFVITDRKAINKTLDAAIAAVCANDLNALRRCTSAAALKKPYDAAWILSIAKIESVSLSGLEITVQSKNTPPTALATFNAIAKLDDKSGQLLYHAAGAQVAVKFRKEREQWLIDSYTVEGLDAPK
jgi:hypothetical protein